MSKNKTENATMRNLALRRENAEYVMFIITTILLTIYGIIMVFSSSSIELLTSGRSPFELLIKQAVFAVIGLVCAVILYKMKYSKMLTFSGWFLLILSIIQCITLVIGTSTGGNKNWISLPLIGQFQPSEFMKLFLILWLALILGQKGRNMKDWRAVLFPGGVGAVLVLTLIALSGDLGTLIIFIIIVFVAFGTAHTHKRYIIGAFVVTVFISFLMTITSATRRARVLGFLSCGDNDQGVCYQVRNGYYAIGNGNWFGVGLGGSTQKWSYLPEAHNDFIFAIIGEELGFLGMIVLLALFFVMFWSLFSSYQKEGITSKRIILFSFLTWLAFQMAINVASVLGAAPVIGVPLPFISAGGSSLISLLAMSGIAAGIIKERE